MCVAKLSGYAMRARYLRPRARVAARSSSCVAPVNAARRRCDDVVLTGHTTRLESCLAGEALPGRALLSSGVRVCSAGPQNGKAAMEGLDLKINKKSGRAGLGTPPL